jgi:hypothetical protein
VYRVRVPLDSPAFILAKFEGKDPAVLALYLATTDAVSIGTTGCHSMWWAGAVHGAVRVTLTAIGAAGRTATAPGPPLLLRF